MNKTSSSVIVDELYNDQIATVNRLSKEVELAETAYNDALKQKYSGPYPSVVWLIWFPFAFSVITFVWAGNANTRMWVIGCLVLLALAVLGSVLLKVRWETTNRKFAEERDLCKAKMEASKSELERAKDMLAKLDEVKKDKEKKNTSDSNRTIKSDKVASQRKPKKAESSSSETKPRVKNTDVKEKTNTTNITDKTPLKKKTEPNKVSSKAKPDGKSTTKTKSVTTTAATVPNTTKKRTSTKKPSNVKASTTSSSKAIPGMYMYHNPRGICQVVSIEKADNGYMYINVKLLERDGKIIPLQYPQVIGNQLVFLSEDEIQKRLSELNQSEDVNSSNITISS